MANLLKMADIQSLLALHSGGWSVRRIARELGIDRGTVSRHLGLGGSKPATEAPAGKLAGESASELAPAVAECVADGCASPAAGSKPATEAPAGKNAGDFASSATLTDERTDGVQGAGALDSKPATPQAPAGIGPLESGEAAADSEFASVQRFAEAPATVPCSDAAFGSRSRCEMFRAVIQAELDAGLTAQRIYQDLVTEHGYEGSYYSVRRLARKLSAALPLPFRRMECAAGAEAQVDFGRGAWIVGADGKRRGSWVFRFVLSHSRKGYSEGVSRQTSGDFLLCLENAFVYFGGVPRTLVLDNLAAAVKHADWYDPELNPRMRSFAEHYGIAVLPTRPRTPRHKGKIENGIGYVKGNALKRRNFTSMAEQNRFLLEWESSVADERIHGTTRKHVGRQFEESERGALLPLPPGRFEMFSEGLRAVHRDGHVEVARAYYSVPPEFVGQQVWARWDGRVVRILDQKMLQIALHARQQPGHFSTQNQHIATEKISSVERGAAWLIQRAGQIGPRAQAWAEAVIQCRGVEGMRAVVGLNALRDRHTLSRIDQACGIAHGHAAMSLRVIRQLLQRQGPAAEQGQFEFASEHPIIRPMSDYAQLVQDAFNVTGREPFPA